MLPNHVRAIGIVVVQICTLFSACFHTMYCIIPPPVIVVENLISPHFCLHLSTTVCSARRSVCSLRGRCLQQQARKKKDKPGCKRRTEGIAKVAIQHERKTAPHASSPPLRNAMAHHIRSRLVCRHVIAAVARFSLRILRSPPLLRASNVDPFASTLRIQLFSRALQCRPCPCV